MKTGERKNKTATIFSFEFIFLCGVVLLIVYVSIGILLHRIHLTGPDQFPATILDWFAIIAVAGFSFLLVVASNGIIRLLKKYRGDE